jgi:hypothetical protein
MLVRLRAWLGYRKLDAPAPSGQPDWTSDERRTARRQIAAEELDDWRSGPEARDGSPEHATSQRLEESPPTAET